MKIRKIILSISIGLFAFAAYAQEAIPRGTIIPVSLTSSLSWQKAKPGQTISARVMQDVPLPNGMKIPEGARIVGHIIEVRSATQAVAGHLSLAFDRVILSKKSLPLTMNLRALASPTDVEGAQIPVTGMGCGDTSHSWTTVQVGGDVVYWGGGPVENSTGRVGDPVTGTTGVLVKVTSKPGSPCRGEIGESHTPQPLWVFSSDACGVYGLSDIAIVHAGRTEPLGVIELGSKRGDARVPNGSGMLLRAIGSDN